MNCRIPFPMIRYLNLIIICFIGWTSMLSAKEVPPRPQQLVNDYAGILTRSNRIDLESRLVAYNDTSSTQLAIVIEKSLEGDDLFDYCQRLASTWGIGQEGKDNGILLYIATEDRKLRIHTGRGAEKFLPDALSKRIIELILKPAFREQRYFEGISSASDYIMKAGAGEFSAEGAEHVSGLWIFFILLFFIVLLVVLTARRNRKGGGYYRGGRYDSDGGWWFPSGGGGWSSGGGGGWSGGGGGGGFGGFGGGSFGGGGASGSW